MRLWWLVWNRMTTSGSFVRSSLAVVSGTVASQALLFLLSPLLARMFAPADFGDLANYNAWVSFLALISNLRYEQAMIVARGRIAMNRVVALALALSVVSALIFAAIAVAVYVANLDAGYLEEIHDVVLLIPAGVLSTVIISLIAMFSTRRGMFRQLAMMTVTQVMISATLQVSFGAMHLAGGLVLGALGGSLVTAFIFLIWHFQRNRLRHLVREFRVQQLIATARENVTFPRYTLAADSINVIAQQFVPVFLTAMFGPATAGIYAFSTRVVRVPALVISTSVLTVLRKHAPDRLSEAGGPWRLFKTTVASLSLLAVGPFAVLLLFGKSIFGLVFGARWVEAGSVAQILTPGMMLEFVAIPMIVFFIVMGKQRYAFVSQVANITLLAGALVGGRYVWHDFTATCALIAGAMLIVNVLTIALASRACRTTMVARIEPAVAN
jgi:O-antigen/teichoic acid export membrane protein